VLERRLADACLTEVVKLVGWQPRPQDWLAAADGFVLPSRWEGMPKRRARSDGRSLPVIATNVEGTAELVVPGETGWLTPPRPRRPRRSLSQTSSTIPTAAPAMGDAARRASPSTSRSSGWSNGTRRYGKSGCRTEDDQRASSSPRARQHDTEPDVVVPSLRFKTADGSRAAEIPFVGPCAAARTRDFDPSRFHKDVAFASWRSGSTSAGSLSWYQSLHHSNVFPCMSGQAPGVGPGSLQLWPPSDRRSFGRHVVGRTLKFA